LSGCIVILGKADLGQCAQALDVAAVLPWVFAIPKLLKFAFGDGFFHEAEVS